MIKKASEMSRGSATEMMDVDRCPNYLALAGCIGDDKIQFTM